MKPLYFLLNNEEFEIENPRKIVITQDLAVRFIFSFLALINIICEVFNLPHLTISSEEITTVVNVAFLVGTWVWIFWKNNNITEASQAGQMVIDELKDNENVIVEIEDEGKN